MGQTQYVFVWEDHRTRRGTSKNLHRWSEFSHQYLPAKRGLLSKQPWGWLHSWAAEGPNPKAALATFELAWATVWVCWNILWSSTTKQFQSVSYAMQFIFGWTGVTRKTSSLGVWIAVLGHNRLLSRELKSANKQGGPWLLNHFAFTTLTRCWRQLRYTFLDGLLISQIFRQSDLDFWKELQSLGDEIKTKNPWLHPSNYAVKSGGKKSQT